MKSSGKRVTPRHSLACRETPFEVVYGPLGMLTHMVRKHYHVRSSAKDFESRYAACDGRLVWRK